MPIRVLVIDVGGTHLKIMVSGRRTERKVVSGPKMTARQAVTAVKKLAEGWEWDVVSMGYPGPVVHGKPLRNPFNLGGGWVGFDFERAFGCPVRLVNDAAMQAIGSYRGGRMLFLGLGTGLGAAMIVEGVIQPMEIAHMHYRKGRTYEDYLGIRGLRRLGLKKWRKHVFAVARQLKNCLEAEYVVIGGGNVAKLDRLPQGVLRGDNRSAFTGGFRMWKKGYTRGL